MKKFKNYIIGNFNNKTINLESILVRYSVIIFIICITYAVVWYAIGYYPPVIINCTLGIGFLSILYFSSEKISTEILIHIMILLAALLILVLSVLTWKTTPTLIAWFATLPLFAMLTLNKKQALYWTLFSLLLLLASYPLHKFLNNSTNFCIQNPFNIVFNIFQIVGILIFCFIVGSQYLELRDSKQKAIEQKNEDLKNIQTRLELVQKYKDSFFANISHEIRTPLNAIKGVADILNNDNQSPSNTQLIKTLQSSTSHLLLLINNVLEVSKLGEGKIVLLNEIFNLKDVIHTAFDILVLETQKKGIAYEINCSTNLPQFVNGDKQRLTQILVNILGNAIKFTSKGSVVLNVHCISIDKSEANEKIAQIEFEIIDTGIGIQAESLNKLFTEYYQANPSISLKFGGTGLGLNISKKLVELHAGTITCNSKLGHGTTITINIPYKINDSKSKENEHSTIAEDYKIIDNFSILIVDDNEANLLIEQMLFRNINETLQIETADNGLVALEKTKLKKYDLILMDMQMPIMDGIHATQSILRDTNNINYTTPIFGLTADISADNYNKCIDAGMKTVITKPFELKNMIAEIASHF